MFVDFSFFKQLKKAATIADQFFDLPTSYKQRYLMNLRSGSYHGWVASGQEL